MWKPFEERLKSPNPQVRLDAWGDLYTACLKTNALPARDDVVSLNQLLLREPHTDVASRATRVMAGLGALLAATPGVAVARPADHDRPGALGNWLWNPFRACSAVFLPLDPGNHRRDESAALLLARRLSLHAFPSTDFQPVILKGPGLDQLLLAKPFEAFCLIGRPGLYGAHTSPLWSNDRTRFHFSMAERPLDLPIGTLDPEYHRITEQVGARLTQHQTREHDGRRTDFGLVQRFVKHDGMRSKVVVICAGGTSLGTQAAVLWAATEVLRPVCLGGEPIPVPDSTTDDSLLEVLLQVTGVKQPLSWSYEPSQVQVLRLSVDGQVWSSDDHSWHTAGPDTITVVADRSNREQVLEILFDDRPAPLKKDSQSFRLLGSACLQVAGSGRQVVDTEALIRNTWIWGEEQPTEALIHRHFTTLRSRHLHDALTVSRTEIVLHAQVTIR